MLDWLFKTDPQISYYRKIKRWKNRLRNRYLRQYYLFGLHKYLKHNNLRYKKYKGQSTKKSEKEITEALSVVNILKENNIKPKIIFDIGSGIGYFTNLYTILKPEIFIHAIDKNRKMKTKHFGYIPNAKFHLESVYNLSFQELIEEIRPDTIVGIHLCRNLAPEFIDIFLRSESVKTMVLSPCCATMDYEVWTELLYDMIQVPNKQMIKDNHILSIRNNLIMAVK